MSDHGAFASILVDEITKKANRLGFDWKLLPATTQSDIDPAGATRVIIDGDTTAVSYAMSLIDPLPAGHRVMVLFVPPHAAYIVGTCGAAPWVPFPFSSNWGNLGLGTIACAYRRVGDEVQLRGTAVRNTVGSAVVGTLPPGYHPPAILNFAADANQNHALVAVLGGGGVQWTAGGDPSHYLALDTVRFSVTP